MSIAWCGLLCILLSHRMRVYTAVGPCTLLVGIVGVVPGTYLGRVMQHVMVSPNNSPRW